MRPDWTVLDLGCGKNPPILDIVRPLRYLGVDAHRESIDYATENSRRKEFVNCEFTCARLEDVVVDPNSFDVVLMIDVIEHLDKRLGTELLLKAMNCAKHALYVTTPNGFLKQDPYDSNDYQQHLSGWTVQDFRKLGFETIRGGGGPRFLRRNEMQPEQWSHVSNASIRWKPRLLWSIISACLQPMTYLMPRYAFQLHVIKHF